MGWCGRGGGGGERKDEGKELGPDGLACARRTRVHVASQRLKFEEK